MSDKRFCPFCVDEGYTSRVFSDGGWSTLMGGGAPFWDEDGFRHVHDPNKTTSGYHCSEGHWWSESSYGSCPTCPYGSDVDVVPVSAPSWIAKSQRLEIP